MSELKFESINDNDTNIMKNLKGAAPLRYYSQDEILKKEQQPTRYSVVGSTSVNGPKIQNSDVDRWQSSNLNELYKVIFNGLKEKINDLPEKKPIYRDFRDGDVRHSLADISKAKSLVHYSPSHDLNEGLDEALDWYIESLLK